MNVSETPSGPVLHELTEMEASGLLTELNMHENPENILSFQLNS